MRWQTIANKIDKQPLRITQHENCYALLQNPATGKRERIYLRLAFDCRGNPHFVVDEKAQEEYKHEQQRS